MAITALIDRVPDCRKNFWDSPGHWTVCTNSTLLVFVGLCKLCVWLIVVCTSVAGGVSWSYTCSEALWWCDVHLFSVKIKTTPAFVRCVRHSNCSLLTTLGSCLVLPWPHRHIGVRSGMFVGDHAHEKTPGCTRETCVHQR